MFLKNGKYDAEIHHNSYMSVGVPGTVAGLHLAWKENGKLPWKRLVEPAVTLAHGGFTVTDGLARSLSAWLLLLCVIAHLRGAISLRRSNKAAS